MRIRGRDADIRRRFEMVFAMTRNIDQYTDDVAGGYDDELMPLFVAKGSKMIFFIVFVTTFCLYDCSSFFFCVVLLFRV